MKKVITVLNFVAAACWLFCAIIDIILLMNGDGVRSVILLAFHLFCMVCFLIAGILNIKRK